MKNRLFNIWIALCLPFLAFSQDITPDEIRVDYACVKKDLATVIVELSKTSGVNITFNPEILPRNKLVSLNAKNKSVGTILNAVLKDTGVRYKIVGNQLVLVENEFENAEEIITVSGYVLDSLSGEPLAYASVYSMNKLEGTESNEFGFYSLSLPKGIQRVYYSYLGYKKEILELRLKKDTTLNAELTPDAVLNEVLILDSKIDEISQDLHSNTFLPVDQIWSITSLGGESDIFGMTQMLSGVSTGADGFGGINVRGGSYDQNLILYDGIPVYNSSHALGVISIFNPSTLKSAQLLKGSFPARYGGRLSSVMNVLTKEGSTRKMKGDLSIGTLAFRTTLEGPLGKKNNSSFMLSLRRTHLDLWLLNNISNFIYDIGGLDGETNYSFYDLNAKINFKLNRKHKLQFSWYSGKDDLDNDVTKTTPLLAELTVQRKVIDTEWGNKIFSAKLNSEINQKLYHNLTIYSSGFDLDNFNLTQIDRTLMDTSQTRSLNSSLFRSKINDLGVRSDFDFVPNANNFWRFGLSAVRHNFEPGLINSSAPNADLSAEITIDSLKNQLVFPNIKGTELTAYVENEIKLSQNLYIHPGLRYNLVLGDKFSDHSLEPRFSVFYQKNDVYLRAGASRMSQYLHLLANGGFGLPTDVWIPSTDIIRPEKAWIFSAGIGFKLSETMNLDFEAYFKNFDRVISFSEGLLTPIDEDTNWEQDLPIGRGKAQGLEINLTKRYGQSNISANYTLSESNRTFPSLNGGNTFAFRFDRTHQFKFGFIQKINKNAEFSSNWQISSGTPVSVPFQVITTFVDGVPVPVAQIEGRNEQNLPLYHRLDLGFNFYNTYSWAKQKFSIGVYNAYNRENPFYIDIGTDDKIPTDFITEQFSILPILPYVSYSLAF